MAVHVPSDPEAQLEAPCPDDVHQQHPVTGKRRSDYRSFRTLFGPVLRPGDCVNAKGEGMVPERFN